MVLLNQQQEIVYDWEFSHLDSRCFQDFLDLFSKAYPDVLNLVQMDNVSFHKSLDLKWPDNVIIPIFQPPNSPLAESYRTLMGTHQVRTVLGTLRNFRSIKTEVKTSP